MIDSNVWVAAVISPSGAPARVVEAVWSDRLVAVATEELLEELAEVLFRPKLRRWISAADAVAFVESLTGVVDMRPSPECTPGRVRDPDDDYLVALAEAERALLVTGDADLLEAELDPPAVSPRGLLDLLGL